MNDLNVVLLKKQAQLVHFWDYIRGSFDVIAKKTNDSFDAEELFKLLSLLIDKPEETEGYVALVIDETQDPHGLLVAYNATQPFQKTKYHIVKGLHHDPFRPDIGQLLMNHFERWAKARGGNKYIVSTRRSGRPAERYFRKHYGLVRTSILFEKDL